MSESNKELVIVDQYVFLLIEFYFKARLISRRCVNLEDALGHVLLHVYWQLALLCVGIFDLVVQDRLLTLHIRMALLVADLELRNPYLLISGRVVLLLGERVDGIPYFVVHRLQLCLLCNLLL